MLNLNFSDNNATQLAIAEYLRGLGIPAGFAMTPQMTGERWKNRMTEAEIISLANDPLHEAHAHGKTHPPMYLPWSRLSKDALIAEATACRQWWQERVSDPGASVFRVIGPPVFGNRRSRDAALDAGWTYVYANYYRHWASCVLPGNYAWEWHTMRQGTLQSTFDLVERAADPSRVVTLAFHELVDEIVHRTDTLIGDFELVIDYATSLGVPFTTILQLAG